MGLRKKRKNLQVDTHADLEQANRSLERAKAEHRKQRAALERARQVSERIDRLAEGNHLGSLMWDVFAKQD